MATSTIDNLFGVYKTGGSTAKEVSVNGILYTLENLPEGLYLVLYCHGYVISTTSDLKFDMNLGGGEVILTSDTPHFGGGAGWRNNVMISIVRIGSSANFIKVKAGDTYKAQANDSPLVAIKLK